MNILIEYSVISLYNGKSNIFFVPYVSQKFNFVKEFSFFNSHSLLIKFQKREVRFHFL